MNIFLYEFVTGGGLFFEESLAASDADSLAGEGRAMLLALAEDFLAIDGVSVTVLQDLRVWSKQQSSPSFYRSMATGHLNLITVDTPSAARRFWMRAAQAADYTIVIAPEINGHLLRIVDELEAASVSLLSPPATFVQIAADKLACCQRLQQHDCATIETSLIDLALAERWLADGRRIVTKPRFGAGSQGIQITDDLANVGRFVANDQFVMQPLESGQAVSVAAICSGRETQLLPACRQHLGPRDGLSGGTFQYQGGSLPLDDCLNRRAHSLARKAITAMPPTIGYCGLDLLLGDRTDAAEDKVVEINPRLTTSYVGLRAACVGNLALAMLQAAQGRTMPLAFSAESIEFDCLGNVSEFSAECQPGEVR